MNINRLKFFFNKKKNDNASNYEFTNEIKRIKENTIKEKIVAEDDSIILPYDDSDVSLYVIPKNGSSIDNVEKVPKNKYEEDLQLALALSLSHKLEIPKNKTMKLLETNICENVIVNEEITKLQDFDQKIKDQIEKFGGSQVIKNEGGGNCLFYSLSIHLDINHKQLREDSINYIYMSWNRFKEFALNSDTLEPFESKDDYKEYMSQDGRWGDHLSLLALCELYQVNAILIITNGKKLSDPVKINVGSEVNILIKFHSEFHYEAIV